MTTTKQSEYTDDYEMFKEYNKTGDKAIRDKIFAKYMYVTEILAKKFVNRGIDYDDLYQTACIGLINAIGRFDVDKGVKFVSYATPTIIGEIKRYFRDKGSIIRVPRRIYEFYQKMNNAKQTLSQRLDRPPTVEELATYLNVSEEIILEAMEFTDYNFIQSLEQPMNSQDNVFLHEFIGREDPDILKIEDKDFIERSFSNLSDAEKKFIKNRYYKNKTQKQIAEIFGVSQMYISRLEKKVLEKLKRIHSKSVI